MIALRQLLKRAVSDGWIQRLPTEGLNPLKTKTVKRQLITAAELAAICAAAVGTKKGKDGQRVPLTAVLCFPRSVE